MIKRVNFIGFYENNKQFDFRVEDNLFILTGDNGSGKTTILNMVYYALNGSFEWFMNKKFEKIIFTFDKNKIELTNLEITKGKKQIIARYKLKNRVDHIVKVENGFLGESYSYESDIYSSKNDNEFFLDDNVSLNDLIKMHPTLSFIEEIRKSLLYFPTYRRIDSDIKNLIKNDNEDNKKYINTFKGFKSNINTFSNDRRVMGVVEDNIVELYRQYSESLRNFNSEGLDNLLKKFIRDVIESLYEETSNPNKSISSRSLSKKAPSHLLDLAEKLGIEDIDKKKVYNYYAKQRNISRKLDSLKSENGSEIIGEIEIIDGEEKINKKFDVNFIDVFLSSFGKESLYVNKLTLLYMEHIREQEKKLQNFRYLEEGFDLFFRNKLTIEMNKNYELHLSTSFSNLSTGQQQLITLLSYSVFAINENVFNPLIIIDEPELSLHVAWQSRLISHLLKKESTSLIIATHSPFIAKKAYSDYVYQLGDIDD